MKIILDPTELVAAAGTLRACSREAADIGAGLWACTQSAMPADVQGGVDHLVSTVDHALDSVAAVLDAHAVDLTNRAHVATSDSLASALIDSGYGAPAPASVNDALTSALVAAGYGDDGRTVISGGSLLNDLGLGVNTPWVISGGSPFDNLGIGTRYTPNDIIPNTLSTSTTNPMVAAIMAAAGLATSNTALIQRKIGAMVAAGNLTAADFTAVTNIQSEVGRGIGRLIASQSSP